MSVNEALVTGLLLGAIAALAINDIAWSLANWSAKQVARNNTTRRGGMPLHRVRW